MPGGSYAGDACGVLRRACEEHASCGVPSGPAHSFCELRCGVPAGPTGVDSGTNPFGRGIIVRGKVYNLVVLMVRCRALFCPFGRAVWVPLGRSMEHYIIV
jgi:hypothetical protein